MALQPPNSNYSKLEFLANLVGVAQDRYIVKFIGDFTKPSEREAFCQLARNQGAINLDEHRKVCPFDLGKMLQLRETGSGKEVNIPGRQLIFGGFWTGIIDAVHLSQILNNNIVEYVYRDKFIKSQEVGTQFDAPWGISRLNRRDALTGQNALKSKFEYSSEFGRHEVFVYVVDTGIDDAHCELQGKVDQLNQAILQDCGFYTRDDLYAAISRAVAIISKTVPLDSGVDTKLLKSILEVLWIDLHSGKFPADISAYDFVILGTKVGKTISSALQRVSADPIEKLTQTVMRDLRKISGLSTSDTHGHGTHCAGTIAGNRFGVAKTCRIINVSAMDAAGSCLVSDLMISLLAISLEAEHRQKIQSNVPFLGVVNLSLGSLQSDPLDWFVNLLIEQGLHVIAAACNQNGDAKNHSPARVESVITVGASTFTDSRAWFSNKGPCVDLYAPGVFITSATYNPSHPNDIELKSGTSMACAHVSGLAAYLLSLEGKKSPEDLKRRIVEELSLKDVLSDIPRDSHNRLAHSGQKLPPSKGQGEVNRKNTDRDIGTEGFKVARFELIPSST